MKYLPLANLDLVTNALNFSTPDQHIIGGCDVYTTKAAGTDKKLYKTIEHSLESQYESLVRLSASLSPPYRSAASDDGHHSLNETEKEKDSGRRKKRARTVEAPEIDLSRNSPFGPLSQINARRTFAYLIATLNASHPDYDFSHILRPSDFRKERSLRAVTQHIDSELQNLRPKLSNASYLSPPSFSSTVSSHGMGGGLRDEIWSPRMWNLIDKEMGLKQCEKYTYAPDDDPFDGEEGALWSLHYFFFNKERKRVCYLYLRGLSVISHSPVTAPTHLRSTKRKVSSVSIGEGAGKRASYWLGTRVQTGDIDTESYGDDDDDEMVIAEPNDDEVEVPELDLDEIRSGLADGGYFTYDAEEDGEDRDVYEGWGDGAAARVRGISEEIGDAMEM